LRNGFWWIFFGVRKRELGANWGLNKMKRDFSSNVLFTLKKIFLQKCQF
jgi:hypothetical protein